MFLDGYDSGLSPTGGIGPLLVRGVPITGISKSGQDYSQLGVWVPDLPADFSGRSLGSVFDVPVSDTAFLSGTEGPVDSNEIDTGDLALLSISEVSDLFNDINASDSASLSISETVNIQASGTPDFAVTDDTLLTITESVAVDVGLDVTDTASISATEDPGTVAVATDTFDVTDTTSLSVSETVLLDIFTGVVDINVDDIAALLASDVAAIDIGNFGDIARIRFVLKKPDMRFTIH